MEEEGLRGGMEGAHISEQRQMVKQMTEALALAVIISGAAMMQLSAPCAG